MPEEKQSSVENPQSSKQPEEDRKKPRRKRLRRILRYVLRKSKERQSKKEKKTAEQRMIGITAWATFWIAVFTFLLCIIGFLQMQELIDSGDQSNRMERSMRLQAAQISRQANDMQRLADSTNDLAKSTQTLAREAITQAKASQASAKVARDTFDATIRPQVGIVGISLTLLPHPAFGDQNTQPVHIQAEPLNYGSATAYDLGIRAQVLFESRDVTPSGVEKPGVTLAKLYGRQSAGHAIAMDINNEDVSRQVGTLFNDLFVCFKYESLLSGYKVNRFS